jgi:hypothetical protein
VMRCELAFAACPGAFERMQQPVGVVLAAQVGPSARAGAQLRGGEAVRAVVGVEAGDAPSVFDVGDEQAASAAVVGRQSTNKFKSLRNLKQNFRSAETSEVLLSTDKG